MYALARALPGLPARRPSIESSEKMYRRVMRSAALIAADVGRGACVRGSSPPALVSSVAGCVPPRAQEAAPRVSAIASVEVRLRSAIGEARFGKSEGPGQLARPVPQVHVPGSDQGPVALEAPKRSAHSAGSKIASSSGTFIRTSVYSSRQYGRPSRRNVITLGTLTTPTSW